MISGIAVIDAPFSEDVGEALSSSKVKNLVSFFATEDSGVGSSGGL